MLPVRTCAKYKDSKIERLGLSVVTGTGKCLVCSLLKDSSGETLLKDVSIYGSFNAQMYIWQCAQLS